MKRAVARFLIAAAELSPEQIALLLSVGLVAGVFPISGVPTILCAVAACGLRLNPVTLQLVNHMSAPLQWALLLPLERVGARLCGDGGSAAGQLIVASHTRCRRMGLRLYPDGISALFRSPIRSAEASNRVVQ